MMSLLFNLPKMPKTKVNWLSFLFPLIESWMQFHDKWNRSMVSQISKHLAVPNEQQIVQEINYHSFAQMHNNE